MGFYVNMIKADLDYITVIFSAFLFPILFILFLQRIDVFEREKLKDILYVFAFGCVVSFILSLIYVPVRNFFVPESQCSELITCFVSVALPEEIIKIIPFVLVLKYRTFVDEPIDYLIYASASALGFAFIENIQYIYSYSDLGNIVATRSFLPLIMHMVTSSIFAFGIFLYSNSNRIKYVFYALILASFLHAAYNSLSIAFLVLIFMLVQYAKLIQSLLNISPFYDESKENDIHSSSNFLLYILIIILVLDFSYDLYHNGTSIIFENPAGYIFTLFIPYAIYKIISSRLTLKKANFIALGTRKSNFKFIIEMQDIIINYYKKNQNKF
tara:strand:+ start:108 stop:1088 length:981 start_codon:yes stop_codon:yes gene_type:complete